MVSTVLDTIAGALDPGGDIYVADGRLDHDSDHDHV